jgi:hypothetical protein
MISLLQDTRDLIEKIGNQLLSAYKRVWLPFVGFVTVPVA